MSASVGDFSFGGALRVCPAVLPRPRVELGAVIDSGRSCHNFLGVDSPCGSTMVLSKNRSPFSLNVSGGFLERNPGKNGEGSPRIL